jgi:hypothetical protein
MVVWAAQILCGNAILGFSIVLSVDQVSVRGIY